MGPLDDPRDDGRRAASVGRAGIDTATAGLLARERFGIQVRVRALPSYADQNFLLEEDGGRRYVLKVSRPDQDRSELELENAVLEHLERARFPAPRLLRDRAGRGVSALRESSGARGWLRLLSWVQGRPLAEHRPAPAAVLHDLGRFLGRLDRGLADFDHPAARRRLRWDLRRALEVEPLLPHLAEPRRARVWRALERFAHRVVAPLDDLPHGVCHNDANDWNVLVSAREPGRVAALVDYGDVVRTALVCEPAIAMTYAMLDRDDPVAAACHVLRGYHEARPLEDEEVELLADLIDTRLCVSVTLSAYERARDPANEYVGVTEPHAWRLLERIDGRHASLSASFREACTQVGS